MDEAKLLDAIDAIYETPGNPGHWPEALARIARCFNAKGGVLIGSRGDRPPRTLTSPSLVEAQKAYLRDWWQHDFLVTRVPNMGYIADTEFYSDEAVVTKDEIATHPFYTGFRQQFDIGRFVGGQIQPRANVWFFLTAQRSASLGDFTLDDRLLMERIGRHVERALLLDARLDVDDLLVHVFLLCNKIP